MFGFKRNSKKAKHLPNGSVVLIYDSITRKHRKYIIVSFVIASERYSSEQYQAIPCSGRDTGRPAVYLPSIRSFAVCDSATVLDRSQLVFTGSKERVEKQEYKEIINRVQIHLDNCKY
jgi:hypothetical protein